MWLTVFICWSLYYTAMILKKTNQTLEQVTTTLSLIDQFVSSAKSKIDDFGKTITAIINVAGNLASLVKGKKTVTRKNKSS